MKFVPFHVEETEIHPKGPRGNGWLVGCRVYGRMSHEGPKPMGWMPSVEVFLRDPSPYLREFRRKPRKTPNG